MFGSSFNLFCKSETWVLKYYEIFCLLCFLLLILWDFDAVCWEKKDIQFLTAPSLIWLYICYLKLNMETIL